MHSLIRNFLAGRTDHRSSLAEGLDLSQSASLASLDASEHQIVTAMQIRLVLTVARGASLGSLGALLVAGIASVLTDNVGRQALQWVWALSTTLLSFAVHASSSRALRNAHTEAHWLQAGRTLNVWSALYSGAWGCSPWVFLTPGDIALIAPVTIALTLVIAATSPMAIHRPSHITCLLPVTVISAIGLARFGDMVSVSLAGGVCIAAFAVMHYAGSLRLAVTENIAMRMQSEKLLARMSEQQKITDEALHLAQASKEVAEAADRGKSAFLAAAGHDLRQPMHALVQYVGHLQRINTDPRLADTVVRAGRSLDSMQHLLDSILDISKLMMGAVRPDVAPFMLSTVLDSLDAQMRPIADGKGLELHFDQVDVVVETDAVLLERVLRNLIVNAIRYTPAGRVSVRCRQRGKVLSLAVCDTGMGIPRALQAKVFDEFFQIGNSGRDSRRGLGLGLSLVKHLSALLHLRLRLRSRPDVGSVFMVDVPLGRHQTLASQASGPARADRVRGAFVVLIDDNLDSLEATSASLVLFGCRVLTASSGIEALDKLQHQEQVPHLVISDYRLAHGETGLDAARMVVSNQRELVGDDIDIPVLIVSGETSPVEIGMVHQAGLTVLHKPLSVDRLYAEVNAVLTRLAVASPAPMASVSAARS